MEHNLLGLASIIILGIAAQWLAWRVGLPSILLLLIFGFVAGPVTNFLHPDELLGDILFPFVSMAVAIILFEGGMSLKIGELRETWHIVRNLIILGGLLTWMMSATAAHYILELAWPLALLMGAVLIVTGPTVIIPLLRDTRIVGKIGSIVKWEGIVNDPIGAVLAVLVFEATLASSLQETTMTVTVSLLQTITYGLIIGLAAAWLLLEMLKRYWLPDYLQNPVTLTVVLAAFTASNMLQAESGLLTVTLMGILLANQKAVSIRHIVQFKENLGVLLLSSLFIILAARLNLETLQHVGWRSFTFLAALVLLVRPLAVWLATIKTGLSWREKLFLSWMAPRGIVAAAVTAIFALELAEKTNYAGVEVLVPEMFVVIVGTVTIYGLSAAPLGRWLDMAQPNPQGVLFVGAHAWARKMAKTIQSEGFQVLMVDTNHDNLIKARVEGLPTFYASILSEYILDEIEMGSLGRLMALTPNDEVNSLATLHFGEVFDQSETYQLYPKEADSTREETVSPPLRGRFLFNKRATYAHLDKYCETAEIKKTQLTEEFTYKAYKIKHGNGIIPLFLIDETGKLFIFAMDQSLTPKAGDTIISLVMPTDETEPPAAEEEEAPIQTDGLAPIKEALATLSTSKSAA